MAKQLPGEMSPEMFGMIVRAAWVDHCRQSGVTDTRHLAPWAELSEWDRDVDRKIGLAVAEHVAAHFVALVQEGVDNVRHSFEHLYPNAGARIDEVSKSRHQ